MFAHKTQELDLIKTDWITEGRDYPSKFLIDGIMAQSPKTKNISS